MKKQTVDTIVGGLVLAGLALFGARGFLPDVVSGGQLAGLIGLGGASILGYAIGQSVTRCEPACDPKVCSAV